MPPRHRFAALAVLAASLAAPATAVAATSANWAGYVAHGPKVKFRTVRGAWTVPAVDCSTPHRRTYSAAWIGIGGYHSNLQGLEQAGTEADCHHGIPHYGAWYELVPAPEVRIPMQVRPGDRFTARVTVRGRRTAFRISNLTTGRTFQKTVSTQAVDITSAEWIVEAPSSCDAPSGPCRVLPLANFGATTFTAARAVTVGGHQGTVGDPAWRASKINLSGSALRIGTTEAVGALAGADTGALTPSGTSFTVTYVPAG